ncbi:MAG: metalloprotease TldD [Legionellales bacterium]|nr:metalloprotease TldD [Legionellales bacterium]
MTDASSLTLAQQILLEPADLTQHDLHQVLGQLLGQTITQADLYLQNTYHESWSLEDGKVKEAGFNINKGVGIRAIAQETVGFAYADDLLYPALTQAAQAARSIAGQGQTTSAVPVWRPQIIPAMYPAVNPLASLSKADKIAILHQIDRHARQLDHRVHQVNATLVGRYDVVLTVQSDGVIAADVRPLVRLSVSVIVEEGDQRQQGFCGGGARSDFSLFTENDYHYPLHYAGEAVREAVLKLQAIPAPAGSMPVVLGPGWPGVLLHEAVGHGLEGDFNRKGVSAFSNRLGERVAAPGVSVVDNGTLTGRRGSLTMDDEGTPTQCTTLIEDGILVGYMQDKLNAQLMGMQSTGNCRRESYAHTPMPRMTNTYMLAGQYAPEEIIQSVERGIYAVNFSGGQVDITSGKFVFSVSEGYLIENGQVTRPIKDATLIGDGPTVLTKVSMVGNNLQLDGGIGTCGKEGQSVPVGVGQPTLKVDELTVGGAA